MTRLNHPRRDWPEPLADSGTAAHVSWTLREQRDTTTLVELTAVLGPIARGDRLLLAVGGRRWIRSLLAATLQRLAAELETAPTPPVRFALTSLSLELAPFDPA